MTFPTITIYSRDVRKLREFIKRPNGSMIGEDLTVDAVEGDGLMFKLRPRWMCEPARVKEAERMRYLVLSRAYRALRDLGDDEGAALLNEIANKEWTV
ncbi:hypothetical protein ACTFBT_01150 [Streptomyces microflavus]|uniref:Uncharacterized protein n=1 Tax=Streptomyces microflavus TaxID=1919 RepID=A0A7J0D491_STRMI|nr:MULTISPECIES: hypothetical protein [Streptomyces]MDX2978166.1 hypothetical protein [Streptomyces sp. NRRL_B-2249]GFN09542.1 hypothetical protein Smic_80980 [Streptomyces microflavus]GGX67276.1 hypothetical protein GCM10010298_35020 [Streptomyces microflavus]